MLRKMFFSMALFMVFSPAIAQVCLDDVDTTTATGIRNLEVFTDEFGLIFIDVQFINTTGFNIYGPELDNLPFGISSEDDVAAVELAINNELDATNPTPLYVGLPGEKSYYIGVEEEEDILVIALGSENATGLFWDLCTDFSDCLATGIRTLPAGTLFIYADLGKANGTACGADLPPDWPPTPTPDPAAVSGIPTLTGWALITLATLFGLMVFANRRRLFKS